MSSRSSRSLPEPCLRHRQQEEFVAWPEQASSLTTHRISGVALANGDVAMAEGLPVGTDAWPPAAAKALSVGQGLLDCKLARSFEKSVVSGFYTPAVDRQGPHRRKLRAVLYPDRLSEAIEFVCSDMWKPYLRVIRERCTNAVNILDRLHIVAKMNDALG
jgi:hypothetical protein